MNRTSADTKPLISQAAQGLSSAALPSALRPADEILSRLEGLTEPARQSAETHIGILYSPGKNFAVRFERQWTMPDGLVVQGELAVFSSGGVDFGLVSLHHGTYDLPQQDINRKPCLLISFIQGIKGTNSQELPVRASAPWTMLRHVISSCAPIRGSSHAWDMGISSSPRLQGLSRAYFRPETIDPSVIRAPLSELKEIYKLPFHPLKSPQESAEVRRLFNASSHPTVVRNS